MKLNKSRRSKNVEDRSRESSGPAPRGGNPRKSYAAAEMKERIKYQDWGTAKIRETMADKDNLFRPMITKMDHQIREAKLRPRKNTKIPVPTARPDPKKPYKRPTVFTY